MPMRRPLTTYALLVIVVVASLLYLPGYWARNQYYLKVSSALLDIENPERVAEVERLAANAANGWAGSILAGDTQTPADYSLHLGQLYLMSGDYGAAESTLNEAIANGSDDARQLQWLADALMGQDKLTEATLVLRDLLVQRPLDRQAHESMGAIYALAAEKNALAGDPLAAGSFELQPDESVTAALSLQDTLPRRLLLNCHGEAGGALDVSVDGQRFASTCGPAGEPLQALVPSHGGAQVQATLRNTGESPIRISDLRLEYITNVELYDENPDAAWTDLPHKVIRAGDSYETQLHLEPTAGRTLTVGFFNFADRYLDVYLDGVLAGRIEGGQQVKGYHGGPTPFEFAVPDDLGETVNVTLHCPDESPPGGVAINSLYLGESGAGLPGRQ